MTRILRPLVLALLALLSGLLPALRLAPDPLPLLLAASVALALAAAPRSARRGAWRTAALLAAFALVGAASGASAARQARHDCRARLPDGAAVHAHGILAAGTIRPPGGADVVLLPLERARLRWRHGSCAGTVRVRLPEHAPALPAGAELSVQGEWVRSAGPVVPSAWPVPPEWRGLLVADTVLATAAPDPRRHPLLTLRGRSERALLALFPRHFALADALLLGRREWMDAGVRRRFTDAGLAHLLAISGLHVALLAGALLLLGQLLRLPAAVRGVAALGVVGLYLAVIGAPESALRAGVMVGLALLGAALQRPASALASMSAAALLLLALDPLSALDPGFQLSFAGVLGLLVAARVPRPPLPAGRCRAPLRALVDGLVVSACAFLLTAPVVVHHFGAVAPVSILANLPAVPLSSLAVVGVAASLSLYPVAEPLARLLADGAGATLEVLDRIAGLAAEAPLGHFGVARPPGWLWIAVPLAALAAARLGRGLRPPVRTVVVAGAGIGLLLAGPALGPPGGRALEIHVLDVGQGDAVAVRTPAGRWLLVDAGPPGRDSDAGERRVLPFLRARGARRLEALLLTHPDADHIGGAASVLRGIPVRRVVEPGLPVGKAAYTELLRVAEAEGVGWSAARAGRSLRLDGVELRLLWPDREVLERAEEANEVSVVAHLRFGAFAALLTGDAPLAVEEALVRRHGAALRAQLLKAGHHGSETSTGDALLDAVRPELVVVSAGRRNRYGHPAPGVLARLRRRGIEVARTDREGTVSLRIRAPSGDRWSRGDP